MSNTSREREEEVYTLSQVDELIQYCADGKLDIVRLYINNDTVNCVDNEGRTPLYAAACSGNVELCKYLLSSNADANQQTRHDFYPIHGASSHGHDNVLSLLLKHVTGIDAQDSNGDTALHLACCRGNEECVNILLDAGSALDIRNNMDKTPGMEAASNSHINIMQVLKDFRHSKVSAEESISTNNVSPRSDILSHKSIRFFSSEDSSILSHQSYKSKPIIQTIFTSDEYVDDFRIVQNSLKANKPTDCVIMNMLECFKPSQESLMAFRLSIVKQLIRKQDSGIIVKEFFVMLFTLRKRTTPEIVLLITNILLDFRIDDVFDLYSDYEMEKFMSGNVDFSINTNQECLFIRDAVSSKIELISFDAIGMGNFNIKIAIFSPEERRQFYDSSTERVNNEKLLKYLSKYDVAYQIPYHTCILQPSHIYLASTEDYLPFLNSKDFPIPLFGPYFFILTPIFDTCLLQLFNPGTKNLESFRTDKEMIMLSFLSDCLLALEHLRQHGIVHRNISSQNILVDMKQQRALLSNFSTCIKLFDLLGKPYTFNDVNNDILLFDCSFSAPELVYFSSLPRDKLSKLDLEFVYGSVDAYSIGCSFYQCMFLEDTEAFPFQEYEGESIIALQTSGSTRFFLEKILLKLLSTSPQTRAEPFSVASLIFCLLSLKENISREPSDFFLTSLLANFLTNNHSLTRSTLYFSMLCGKDEFIQAQDYYFNK